MTWGLEKQKSYAAYLLNKSLPSMKQNLFNLITSYRLKNRILVESESLRQKRIKGKKMSSYLAFKGGCLEK